jgi:hypothetical protein
VKNQSAFDDAQERTFPDTGISIRRNHLASRRMFLTLAASLALSAVTLPAVASHWWTQTPSVSIGATVLNVKNFGAIGNGAHDDTAAIQAAIDALPSSGGTIVVPDGTYMINALKSINLRSHMRLSLASGTYLKAIANDAQRYWTVKLWGVNNVEIVGGHIVGDRSSHRGSAGEWGYGLVIQGSSDVYVHDITVTNTWGDGLLVRAINYDDGRAITSERVTFNRVKASNNRRQGLSICAGNKVYVVNSSFTGSNGTAPQGGIDIEPQTKSKVWQVRIENTTLSNNVGNGLEVHDNVNGLSLYKVTAENNKGFGVYTGGPTNVSITNSNLSQNYLFGVSISAHTSYVTLADNTITYNGDAWFYAHGKSVFAKSRSSRDVEIASSSAYITQSNNTISP